MSQPAENDAPILAERDPSLGSGYRWRQTLVDEAADLIVKDAGGFAEDQWADDPRNTAQKVFDLLAAALAEVRVIPPANPCAEMVGRVLADYGPNGGRALAERGGLPPARGND